MSQIISLFPTYDNDTQGLFSLSDYQFYYEKDGEDVELFNNSDESLSGEIVLEDEMGFWSPDEYSLKFTKQIEVKNASMLYESDSSTPDCKIACSDAIIGIGMVWSSPSSSQKGAFDIGEVKNYDRKQIFKIDKTFPKGKLRGEIVLSIVLYIKAAGNPVGDELIYANEPGSRVGEIETFAIRLDGNGSFFPMKEVDRPGDSLWSVECNWTDPSIDAFSDCITILLNRAHKNYKYLDRSNTKDFQPQLLLEILASAVGNVIETLREEDKEFLSLQDAQEGSVSLAIRYFKDNLEWDISTPTKTSASIRRFLEQKILKG